MNRRILNLAIPNVISNITIPLLGMIDIAIAGRLGDDAAIAALAIVTTIFGFIYWNCAFIRMGTSGMTAQAFGERNLDESANLLVRGMAVSLSIAALLLIFRGVIGRFAVSFFTEVSPHTISMVEQYFYARIWAAPATVSLYAIHGWFIGMQNSRIPMYISIIANAVNIVFSLLFVFVFDMGVAGIAWGTVVTQYSSALISWLLWYKYYRRFFKRIDWAESLRLRPMMRFFNINKDIFLRTACNVAVYTSFTVFSADYGELIVATNTILMQLFMFFSYMSDGFSYAAEALTGRFIGARNYPALRKCIAYMFWWSLGIAVFYVGIYIGFWRDILAFFTESATIIACAGEYIIWIVFVSMAGFAPFLMDGILIGATQTRVLRDSMFLSTILFFALYYLLSPKIGSEALWVSFLVFLFSRGIWQWIMTKGLKGLYRI